MYSSLSKELYPIEHLNSMSTIKNTNNPIGILDSGVGGLTVAKSIREQLPNENILYIADSFHAPYGDKSNKFVEERIFILVKFLINKNAKAIVIACNTATVNTIHKLRAVFDIPVIGVEPGVKPASLITNTGIVGVLATTRTVKSQSFNELVNKFSTNTKFKLQPCPGLVEQIESHNIESSDTEDLIKQYVTPLLESGVDTLVLGCTHYYFLESMIRRVAGKNINIISTQNAIAKEVTRRLTQSGLLSLNHTSGADLFFTTSNKDNNDKIFSHLWGKNISVSHIDLR